MKQLQLTMPSSFRCCCVGVALLLLAPPPAAPFSRGADPASCQRMVPGHIRARPQPPQRRYVTVHASASSYRPGQLVAVTVRSSRDFMGFLLQAGGADAVGGGAGGGPEAGVGGTWALTPPGVHVLHCRSEGDAVTHSDKQLKRNLSFVWRAPDAPVGDVRFRITVVQSYFVYWANIEAAVVHDGSRSSWRLASGVLMTPTPHQGGVPPELTGASSPSSRNQTVPLGPTAPDLEALVRDLRRLVLPWEPGPTRLQSGPAPPTEAHLRPHRGRTSPALSSTDEAPPPGGSSPSLPRTPSRPLATGPLPSTSGHPTSAARENQSEAAAAPRPSPSAPSTASPPSSSSSSPSASPPLPPPPPPGPSPAPRRSPDVPPTSSLSPVPSRPSTTTPTQQDVSIPAPRLLPTPPGPVVHPDPRPRLHPDSGPPAPVRPLRPEPPDREGERPQAVPRRGAWELGMLLGCSAGLGAVLVAGVRHVYRQSCGRRTAVTLNDRAAEYGRREPGLVHVQECGDLVRVRRIRENSLVLLAEYDVLAPPGD